MNLTPAQLGFIRALGTVVVFSALSFLGDAANLNGVVPEVVAGFIAMVVSSIEQHLAPKKGALFGAAR